jgi:vacuolar protein sorting-associated protein 13A/C
MFEKYLEQILKKQLGKFVSGFDSGNLSLGVWSGNIVIENVSIKPEVFQTMELPVELVYSYVGRLQIKVPWARLTTQPIEVVLDKVYMVVRPIAKESWKFFDFKALEIK